MSGHSHYATIHRQKEIKDAQKGKVFSKLAREITIAAKTGGNSDPNFNFKLRIIIDKARAANMPKTNIERAISNAATSANLDEVNYEGFGPGGIGVIVQAATDNHNRTAQEIKGLFERAGGSMAGPGAVSFNFENKGLLLIEKTSDPESQMLTLIDLGVDDVQDTDDGIEVYTAPDKLSEIRDKVEQAGFTVKSAELFMKPKTLVTISDPGEAQKAIDFLDNIDEHDDVQKVFSNLDVPDEILNSQI